MKTTVSKLKPGDVLVMSRGVVVEISPVKGEAFDVAIEYPDGVTHLLVWRAAMPIRVARAHVMRVSDAAAIVPAKPKAQRIPRRGKPIRIRGVEHVIADIDRSERMVKTADGKWYTFDEISR